MRVIGKYKDQDVVIKSLYLLETYEGYLLKQRGDFSLDADIVKDKIAQKAYELFGLHKPYCIVNVQDIDYRQPLPEEVVYVLLECNAPVGQGKGSYLVLIWFQHTDQNPFKLAADNLKTIEWEKHAEDFET